MGETLMRHALFAALFALLLPCTSAVALDQAKVAAVTKAADAFALLAADSEKTGQVPRETDAVAKPLLDTVFDTSVLEKGGVQPMSELNNVNAWNMAVLKVGVVYMLAGTGAKEIGALPQTPEAMARVDGNTVTFAPEVGRYLDAQLRLQMAIIDTVQDFIRTATRAQLDNPNVKSSIGKIRGGTAQTISGAISTLALRDQTDDWRRARLTVLEAMAPKAAPFLVAEDRQALRAAFTETAAQMQAADVKARMQKLGEAFGLP
jgi:hypothetical protein